MDVKAVAASGMIGTGFASESLAAAIGDATFVGCDGGSTDAGPYYLGSGNVQVARDAAARDMELILAEALKRDVPVLVGSSGTAGGRPHLDFMLDVVRDLARQHGWHFKLASIDSELDRGVLVQEYRRGRFSPLAAAPPIDEDVLTGASRIVGMMGVEPFHKALDAGAQVIIAGRSSDTSIYASVPVARGVPPAVAWHAAKVLECGAASVEQRMHPDSMVAELDQTGFTIYPPNPKMRCTPASVLSHSLYENANPYKLVEPGGVLDTTDSSYEALDERRVRVTGSQFHVTEPYTIRLEGAALVGYRAIAISAIRDPVVLRQLDRFLAECEASIRHKVKESLHLSGEDYTFSWRVYGRDGALGKLEEQTPFMPEREVGVVIDVVAPKQETARAIVSVAWHTALHQPVPEYSGLVSNLAFPYSPPGIDAGPVYRFCLNHVLECDSGPAAADLFKMEMETV